VESRCGSLTGKSARSFSSAQPVDHVSAVHGDLPMV
jgi:hypothetical protein